MTEKEIYKNGVALLEEWEDVNYCEHNFKFKDEWLTDKEVVDLLSHLNDENDQLIREKERYKTLHAIACEQIDNRILTINNFVEECSDDKVKNALKKLLCTEVQAYDISAKNRALMDENEQLKQQNEKLNIDFVNFKMKLIEKLQIHYSYAKEQRQKNLNDPFVAKAYDIIRHDVRELANEMGVDLE